MYEVIHIYIYRDINPAKRMRGRINDGMFRRKEHQTLQENQRKYYNFLDILNLKCHPRGKQVMDNSLVKEEMKY